MSILDAFKSPTPPEPNQPIPSAPITPVTPAIAPKPATGSILDAFRAPSTSSQPQPTPSPVNTPQVKSPYFSAVDKSGNSLGFSDQTDVSGKPYFAYRNPGDTSTTTDKTRVATTFDPRVPQKLDPEVIQNGRLPESMSAPIKKELGGSYSDELDHTIALELSGSNDQSNLKVEPGIKGGESANFDKEENDLAHQVATGKVSLWDAQVKLASNKASKGDGNPVPWTAKAKSPGFWDDVKNAVGSLGKDAQDVIDKVKNTFLPQSAKAVTGPKTVTDLQNQILQDVPFTDKGKDIVNNQTKINLADPETHSAAANSQPGSPVGRSEINLRSADKPDDEKFLTHEFFNVIFSREKINPTAFNKAWQQAMKGTDENSSTLKRIDDELLNNADSASTYRNTDPNQENVTRDPEVLASERFASVGDTLGVDGISSIPKPLQSFYKAYLADTDQSKTPQPETEPTPQKNTTGSILDAFKGQNQDQVQPVTEHHYDLNNPDGLTKEQSYLGQVSTNISSQEKALSSAKVDHTDKAAVDAFNANVNSYKATVDAYNARSDAFNKAVEAYSKKNPPAPDENLKALEGQNATLSKANPTNVSQEQINQKDPFGALFVKAQNLNPDNTNIKIPFTTNRYVSIPALQVDPRVFGGNSTIKPLTTVTDLATNLPSQIVQAVPRAAVILKEEFTPDSLKGEKNKTLAPFEASLYGDATYKNTYADIQDRIRNGDGVLSAYIGGISAKVLDVAFGASVVASGFRVLSGLLAKSSPYSTIEAWKTLGSPANDVEATKNYQQLVKQFTPDNANPGGGNPEAFQTLQKARDILDKNGIPNTIKLYAQSSAQYAEWLGRETKLGDPIFNLNTKINGDGINPKPLGLKALSDGKTDDVVVDTPPKSVPQETLEASGASEINQNEENNSSQQEGVEVSSKPSNTVFKSGKIKSPSQEEMPILNKINAVIAGTSKTEVIAHTPSFLAQDNKERPLILSKGIVDKIQNDHGKIVPENLLQNANHWDAAIKNIKPQGGGAPGAEKINLLKKIPGTDNILVLAANRDNGFFTVSHYEIIPKKGNEIKSLLGRGSLLSPSGSPLAPKDFLTAPPAQGSSEGVLGNGGDGVSAGSRTQISNLEGLPSNPLTYKDNSTLPKTDNPVKSDKEKSPQSKTQSLNPGPKAPIAEIRNLLKTKFPDVNRNVIFDKSLLKNTGDHGQFYSKEDLITGQLRPIIRLYEKNGMAYVRTAYHELGHYLESLMPSWVIQQLDDETRAIMTPKDFRYYRDQGYKTETEQLSEFRQDNFGKEEADKAGHKSAWQKIADIIRDFLQKISDAAKAIYKKFYADIPNKQGGFINFGADLNEEPEEIKPEHQEIEAANTERNKIEDSESKSVAKPTELETHLADLQAQKSALEETINNSPARELNKHFGRSSDTISQQLENAKGTPRATFIQNKVTELGYANTEAAQLKLDNHGLLQKRLEGIENEIAETKAKIAQAKLEDADAKRLSSFLDKNAKITDKDINKQERLNAIKKAEETAAKNIADQEKYRAQLESNIKKNITDSQKPEGIIKGILRALNPIKHLKPSTKATVESWMAHRTMADILAKEEYSKYPTHTKEGMNTIVAQQDGAKIPWLTTAFENMYTEGNRRGLDIGHQDNYVPQVWKETGDDIKAVIAKRMEAQGVNKADIEGYLNNTQELDKQTAARLKLNPSFSKQKIVPDYRTGMSMGLHPKYQNPVQLIAYYRQEMEHAIANRNLVNDLLKNGDLLKVGLEPDMPKGWVATTVFGKTYWAPKALGNFLNDYLRDEDNLSWDQKIAKNVAKASHVVQNIGLMAGIPGTTIQSFPVSLLYTEVAGYGNFKAIKPWLVANSSKATSSWIENNWKYIRMMAEDGVPVGNLAQGEWNKESLGQIFKDTKLTNIDDVKSLAYQIWNRGWQTRVYDRMMPMLSVEMYKSIYEQGIKKGLPEAEARKLAAESVKTKYVFPATQGRTTQQISRSIFYGPVWRQQVMNMLFNAGKGYSTEFKNPAYSSSRKLLMGILATFVAYQLINKKTSGKFTWENSTGHELDIDIPHADGSHSYVTFFPSFMTVPRVAVGVGTSLAQGNVANATQQGVSALNPILQLIVEMSTNADYFGRAIYKPTDTTTQKYEKLATYAGSNLLPSVIKDGVNYLTGHDTSLQTLTSMTGGIFKFQSPSSSQSDIISKAITQQTTDQTTLTQRAQQLYNQMKGSATARADWEKVNQQDPALAAKISALAKTDKLTGQEKSLKLLGVKNGDRAQAIMKIMTTLSDQKTKHDFYDKLIQDKIATKEVTAQVTQLLDTTAK